MYTVYQKRHYLPSALREAQPAGI